MRSEYFYSFTLSSIVGVAVETQLALGYPFSILCGVLALVVHLLSDKASVSKYGFIVPFVFLGLAFGVASVDVSNRSRNVHTLDSFLGQVVRVDGVVVGEPDVREENTNIVLEVQSVTQGAAQGIPPKMVSILAHIPSYPIVQYGDSVSLTGKIAVPKKLAGANGERPFDYRAYLAKDSINYEMSFSKVSVVAHDKGNFVFKKLLDLKQLLMSNIARVIPEPESSLAGGIVLGAKQSLGKEWMQKFRDAGLAHIVVLSGYNISVVASVIGRAVSFLPFTARLGASAISIILFALMVGGGATVLRATLMALVVILARAMGRESEALRVLIFVGWLMVMINPMILFYDVSFQLSFLAALALVTLAPLIEKYFLFVKSAVLREILVTTIATQIFVAPILLYQMGTFSLVGLVANLFVLPLIPTVMLLVSLVAVIAPVPLLSALVVYPAQFLLSYILYVVEIGSRISFANIQFASFGIILLTISYIIIFVVCVMLRKNPEAKVSDAK